MPVSIEEALHQELGSLSLAPVVRVSAHATLREAAATLREHNVSSALIDEAQREILTERDLTRALAEGLSPDAPVTSIEQRIPVWAVTTSEVIDAAEMMLRHDVRHLIVLDTNGKAVGVISMREILAHLVPALSDRLLGH